MKPETIHRQLRTILAQLYPTPADMARGAHDAGVPLERVARGSSAVNDWDALLHEAANQQGVAALLDVAVHDYGRNPELAAVVAAFAEFNRTQLFAALPLGRAYLLNFARVFTPEQQQALEMMLGERLARIMHQSIEFDDARPYGPQCVTLADAVGLTKHEWETLPIIVNPPGIAPGALCLLSELHGRMGHFPTLVRLCPRPACNPPIYDVAELINLQALRDAARGR